MTSLTFPDLLDRSDLLSLTSLTSLTSCVLDLLDPYGLPILLDLPDLPDFSNLSVLDLLDHHDLDSAPSWHGDVEGAAGDVLLAPLDDEDVSALLLHCVAHCVHAAAQVLDVHLLTGCLGPVYAHHQHVGSCNGEIEGQTGRGGNKYSHSVLK